MKIYAEYIIPEPTESKNMAIFHFFKLGLIGLWYNATNNEKLGALQRLCQERWS